MTVNNGLNFFSSLFSFNEFSFFAVLWGLDADGKFLTGSTVESTTLLGRLQDRLFKKEQVNVREAVLMDLKRINESVQSEAAALRLAGLSVVVSLTAITAAEWIERRALARAAR